jgi:hypothetical protein
LPPESALQRKIRGPMGEWGVSEYLLRRIDLHLAGANWQRSGGKGQKPKPLELPKQKAPRQKPVGADIAQRLRNLGLIPPGDTTT